MVVDDEESIHYTVRQALEQNGKLRSSREKLKELAAKLFDANSKEAAGQALNFDLSFFSQGEEAVEAVAKSVETDRRFAMVFLDMRMPPGQDGLWTARKIRELDDMVNILIMTAYSDIDPIEISAQVEPADKLLYVQKPLRPQEIRQFAVALATKWQSETRLLNTTLQLAAARHKLEKLLDKKTEELHDVSNYLDTVRTDLQDREAKLQQQNEDLDESNIAMKVLLKKLAAEQDKTQETYVREVDERVVVNIKELTEPFLDKLALTLLDDEQKGYLDTLRSNLEEATAPAMQRLYSDDYDLTPSELQVANLVRHSKSTKEIATLLNLSPRTIEFHRDNIRKKLGITDRRTRLSSVLKSI